LIVHHHEVVNGVLATPDCGELSDVVPTLRMIVEQNALLLSEILQLREIEAYKRKAKAADDAMSSATFVAIESRILN